MRKKRGREVFKQPEPESDLPPYGFLKLRKNKTKRGRGDHSHRGIPRAKRWGGAGRREEVRGKGNKKRGWFRVCNV